MQKAVLDLYAHRSPPFDLVVSRVQPARNPSYSPLFQVMFVWRDAEHQPSEIGLEGLEAESLLAESGTAKFDLTRVLDRRRRRCSIWTLNTAPICLMKPVSSAWRGISARYWKPPLENPDQRVSRLPLLSEDERQKVLVEWNQTAADYPQRPVRA